MIDDLGVQAVPGGREAQLDAGFQKDADLLPGADFQGLAWFGPSHRTPGAPADMFGKKWWQEKRET